MVVTLTNVKMELIEILSHTLKKQIIFGLLNQNR